MFSVSILQMTTIRGGEFKADFLNILWGFFFPPELLDLNVPPSGRKQNVCISERLRSEWRLFHLSEAVQVSHTYSVFSRHLLAFCRGRTVCDSVKCLHA